MSKSEENTNELESYGVWVKNTAQTPEDVADTQVESEDSLDLPEFEDTDFSDMFKNDSEFEKPEEKPAEEEINEDNMFANGEELSNDSATDEVILHDFPEDNDVQEETSEESFEAPSEDTIAEDTFEIPEIAEDNEEVISETTDETVSSEISAEEPVFDGISEIETENTPSFDELEIKTEEVSPDADFEEISFDSIDEPKAEEVPKAEKTQLAPGEEEISLDDFLEEGFSDESVASGNNGYEPGKEPEAEKTATPAPSAGGTEEISLDDFMDSEDFGVEMTETSAAAAPAEETPDEPPLDMDISFDDTTDTIETEENKVSDDFSDFTADDSEDFDNEPEVQSETASEEVYVADTSNISTEEVDLSDFGIDSDAEETPVTQNVEEKKAAETVVDYDLTIGDEDSLASAPVINEIKTEEADNKPDTQEAASVQQTQPDPTTTSLLQQIVAELSGLKNDINKLKSEINEVKEREAHAVVEDEVNIESETEDEGGFFSGDEDETIALSADELTNIPIDTDSVIEAESEIPIEEPAVEAEAEVEAAEEENIEAITETESEAEVFESTADDTIEDTFTAEESDSDNTGFFTDEGDDTIALSGDELTNIMNTTEISESEGEPEEVPSEDISAEDLPATEVTAEEAPAEKITSEEITSEEITSVEAPAEDITFDETTEAEFEEPVVEPAPFDAEETAVSEEEVSSVDEEIIEEPPESSEELTFDFEDKNLDEPDIENIHLDEVSETELPDEISIPKDEDNIFVESTASDFMNSVNSVSEDTAEDISEAAEEVSFETTDTIFDDSDNKDDVEFDSPDTLFEEHFDTTETILSDSEDKTDEPELASEAQEKEEASPAPSEPQTEVTQTEVTQTEVSQTEESEQAKDNDIEDVFSEAASEIFDVVDTNIEPETEEIVEESEPVLAETSVEVPVTENSESEAAVTETLEEAEDSEVPTVDKVLSQSNESGIDSNFAEVDNLDSSISKDNIDYLQSDKMVGNNGTSSSNNDDLRRDIKSVLLYMDQLLENLPEEKIMEFAKSDEFVTYKKLFSDLGLS